MVRSSMKDRPDLDIGTSKRPGISPGRLLTCFYGAEPSYACRIYASTFFCAFSF